MDFEKFTEYVQKAGEVSQTLSSAAGNTGYTIGAAIQGYKDGRAGDTTNYRQINDIDVEAGLSADTAATIKFIAFLAVAAVVVFVLVKRKKN